MVLKFEAYKRKKGRKRKRKRKRKKNNMKEIERTDSDMAINIPQLTVRF